MTMYSIGHSNRSLEEFLALLKSYALEVLVDVRAIPSSRKWPHFSRDPLNLSLKRNQVKYLWMGPELGGYRKASDGAGKRSPNRGWKSGGFRIYADYMSSERFLEAAIRLVEIAQKKRTAIMCAERDYRRCHRQLISDYVVSRGHTVLHIVAAGDHVNHELTEFAQVESGILTYPPSKDPESPLLPFP